MIQKLMNLFFYLISHPLKHRQYFYLRPFCRSRILKAPVNPLRLPWKKGTAFLGIVTDRDNEIKFLTNELVHIFGYVMGNINSIVLHHLNGFGIDHTRLQSCTGHLKSIASQMFDVTLCHLGSAGIART